MDQSSQGKWYSRYTVPQRIGAVLVFVGTMAAVGSCFADWTPPEAKSDVFSRGTMYLGMVVRGLVTFPSIMVLTLGAAMLFLKKGKDLTTWMVVTFCTWLAVFAFQLGWTRVEGLFGPPKMDISLTMAPGHTVKVEEEPKSPCDWYTITLLDFQIFKCWRRCDSEFIYQFEAHLQRVDDTLITTSPGVTPLNHMVIDNQVVQYGLLNVKIDIKTTLGETVASALESWDYRDDWGVGIREYELSNVYMHYKIRYKIECREH